MFVELSVIGWIELVWFGSMWIKSEYFWFRSRIDSVLFQFTVCLCPTFLTSKLFLCSAFLIVLLPLIFSTRFSLSFFIVPCHVTPLLTESKMLQFLSMVLVICGCGILMALDGFIPIFSSVFRLKSTLILIPLFRLPKGKSQSLCPCISIEALAWLASVMRFSTNHTLPISSSFDSIVVSENNRCSILVRLVSANWSVVEDVYFLSGIYPKWSGQWYYLYIFEISFKTMVTYTLISCKFPLFGHNLFNLIACIWFNWFARI